MDLRQDLATALGAGYTVERELGGGGMSRVFLVRDHALNRRIVAKLLAPELAAGVNRERFEREIMLAAGLQHPNVVPVLATGTAGELPYFTMPFIEGESLRATLERARVLDPAQAVPLLRDVARALAYAHGRGIVHRDIKPDNVLVSGGAAMVSDFGVARAIAAGRDRSTRAAPELTTEGTSLGTLAYMAPEQAAADPHVDHRADLYAFGAMAYEMLTGAPPFDGRSGRDRLTAILTELPPHPGQVRPDIPASLDTLIMACLAKDPAHRPADAEAVLAGLEEGSTARIVGVRRSRGLLRPGLAAIAVAVVLFAGLRPWRGAGGVKARSIAVLPFTVVGGDSSDVYIADGLTDELTTALSRVPELRVASSTSAFALRDARLDVRTIAGRLGVAQVVEGSVRRDGDRLRVTARLTRARDGITRWAQAYEVKGRDVFGVQDEITRALVDALQLALGEKGLRPAPDQEAYDLYLKGRFYWRQRGTAALRTAAGYFQQALARDSTLARAWAGLADALGLLPSYGPTPVDSVLPIAEHAAARAAALDDGLAEAHAALGNLYRAQGRWQDSEAAFKRALDADSNYATASQWYGELLVVEGRMPEALGALERAARLEPVSPIIIGELGYVRALNQQWDSAQAAGSRAVALAPDLWITHMFLGAVDLWQGRYADALNRIDRGLALEPGNPFAGTRVLALARLGRRAEAEALYQDLRIRLERGQLPPASLAVAATALGETDVAIDLLLQAARSRDAFLYTAGLGMPWFDQLRADSRFDLAVQAMGLDPSRFHTRQP